MKPREERLWEAALALAVIHDKANSILDDAEALVAEWERRTGIPRECTRCGDDLVGGWACIDSDNVLCHECWERAITPEEERP